MRSADAPPHHEASSEYPGTKVRSRMSRDIDSKIKQLFTEADRASPEPPPLQGMEKPAPNWWRVAIAPAAAVLVLFAGTVAVLNAMGVEFGLGFAADSAGSEPAPADSGLVPTLADLNLACTELDRSIEASLAVVDDETAVAWFEALEPSYVKFHEQLERVAAQFPSETALSEATARTKRITSEIGLILA